VLVDGARMPRAREVTESLQWFPRLSGYTVSNRRFERDVKRLHEYLSTATWSVSAARGYTPRKLVLPAMVCAALVGTATVFGVFAIMGSDVPQPVGVLGVCAVGGAIVGLGHWALLRNTRIVIKRSAWRRWVSLWAVFSAGLLSIPFVSSSPSLAEGTVLMLIGGMVLVGLVIAWRESRVIRRVDRNTGCWTGVLLALLWVLIAPVSAAVAQVLGLID